MPRKPIPASPHHASLRPRRMALLDNPSTQFPDVAHTWLRHCGHANKRALRVSTYRSIRRSSAIFTRAT